MLETEFLLILQAHSKIARLGKLADFMGLYRLNHVIASLREIASRRLAMT